ncbi:hypothetical protein RP20_CCG018103 [Aedes albopictus]|nr:hypothetical protein RP20_CCG018103 [Aedes albopictus]
MSHAVVITRTTTTTTSTSHLVLNTGYLKTTAGLLKLAQLIIGAVNVGIVAWYMRRNHSVYGGGLPHWHILSAGVVPGIAQYRRNHFQNHLRTGLPRDCLHLDTHFVHHSAFGRNQWTILLVAQGCLHDCFHPGNNQRCALPLQHHSGPEILPRNLSA